MDNNQMRVFLPGHAYPGSFGQSGVMTRLDNHQHVPCLERQTAAEVFQDYFDPMQWHDHPAKEIPDADVCQRAMKELKLSPKL